MTGSVRVDAWLWAVRVYKTRSAATTACRAGHVRVGGEKAKAAQPVRVGDELRIRIAGFDRILVVRQLLTKRVSAPVAALAAEDRTPAREPVALASHGGRYYARPGFVVQPYAPPNFVPLAWSCGGEWIKLLRVPVGRHPTRPAAGR